MLESIIHGKGAELNAIGTREKCGARNDDQIATPCKYPNQYLYLDIDFNELQAHTHINSYLPHQIKGATTNKKPAEAGFLLQTGSA
ncbi:hypothetical protein [Chitinilyticum piscinae]|uniref:Uncharacterized protein n=1 Tax=Chitinilyticum piscinae TaxID=2866724 RepID=A0A8J7FP05_9NEIS|nr:hypothetical protein [Chitinilyticum piscinae]MBE9609584.1 hypothetical protein [Chitinilyticum piscinae]